MSLRAVVAIGNQVMWPSLQSFWVYAGSAPQAMKCDVQDWFYSMVSRSMAGRMFGSPNPQFSEIHWDWPDESSLECNRYIAVNYGDLTITPYYSMVQMQPWTIGLRNRTCGDPPATMDFPLMGGPLGAGGSLFLHEYGLSDNGAELRRMVTRNWMPRVASASRIAATMSAASITRWSLRTRPALWRTISSPS